MSLSLGIDLEQPLGPTKADGRWNMFVTGGGLDILPYAEHNNGRGWQ